MRILIFLGLAFAAMMLLAVVLFFGVLMVPAARKSVTSTTTTTATLRTTSATIRIGPSVSPVVSGSGTPATATRTLPSFTRVELELSGDFTVQCGQAPGVSLSADDNLINHIQTTVTNGVLRITCDCSYASTTPLRGTITVGSLDHAELLGSGTLTLKGLDTPSLTLDLNGSGTISAQGKTGTLTAHLLGSGDLKLYDLDADDAVAGVQGSGDIQLKANKTLKASVLGSGDIQYKGSAKTTTTVQGSGSIRSQNAERGE